MKKESTSYVKEHITQALLCLMETKTFNSITITDIVKEAMVGRASFYRNFTDKEDILKQYLLRLILDWGEEFERIGDPNWVESLLGHYYNYKQTYLLLYRCGMSHLVLDTIKSVRGPKPEQDNIPAYFSAWFCGGLFGWIDEWITRGMQETPSEMTRLLSEMSQNNHI